jgi:hypothetical protein
VSVLRVTQALCAASAHAINRPTTATSVSSSSTTTTRGAHNQLHAPTQRTSATIARSSVVTTANSSSSSAVPVLSLSTLSAAADDATPVSPRASSPTLTSPRLGWSGLSAITSPRSRARSASNATSTTAERHVWAVAMRAETKSNAMRIVPHAVGSLATLGVEYDEGDALVCTHARLLAREAAGLRYVLAGDVESALAHARALPMPHAQLPLLVLSQFDADDDDVVDVSPLREPVAALSSSPIRATEHSVTPPASPQVPSKQHNTWRAARTAPAQMPPRSPTVKVCW